MCISGGRTRKDIWLTSLSYPSAFPCLSVVLSAVTDPPFDGYRSTWERMLVDKPIGQGAAVEGSVKVFLSIAPTGASGRQSAQTSPRRPILNPVRMLGDDVKDTNEPTTPTSVTASRG